MDTMTCTTHALTAEHTLTILRGSGMTLVTYAGIRNMLCYSKTLNHPAQVPSYRQPKLVGIVCGSNTARYAGLF